jgi:hypothetical protein
MTAGRDRTPYCAAPGCDLNLAGWAHVPWDCDARLPAPTLDAETIARLPVERRPWVQGSARAFAALNPQLCPPREPGEELPDELATDPHPRERLRDLEATAVLGERAEAGLRAECLPPDPERRRVAIADRATFAWLYALDHDLLLHSLARLPQGSPDLSGRSVLDRRFAVFLLSDHPAATFERCHRCAAYLDDTARRREVLHGWLAKLDATPPRPGTQFDDSVLRLAATTRDLLDQEAARLPAEVSEPDPVRVARQRERHGRYPTRYLGRAAARQPIPPERPQQRGGGGHER